MYTHFPFTIFCSDESPLRSLLELCVAPRDQATECSSGRGILQRAASCLATAVRLLNDNVSLLWRGEDNKLPGVEDYQTSLHTAYCISLDAAQGPFVVLVKFT
jgi:hypothetical protein